MLERLKATTRGLLGRTRAERELTEELQHHLQMETRANIAAGMDPAEARRVALRDLGGVVQTTEAVRDVRATLVDVIGREVGFAFRQMRHSPGIAVAALVTLALGMAGTTTVLSIIYGVLIQPLPFPDADKLVAVSVVREGDAEGERGDMSPPDLADVLAQSPAITALVGYGDTTATLTGFGEPVVLDVATLSGGLMTALGVRPLLGRDVTSRECGFGAPPIVVVSHAFWRDRLGASHAALGRPITLNGRAFEVVGVAPQGFDFPTRTDVWIPHRFNAPDSCGRRCHTWTAVGRIAPDATLAAARAEAATIAENLARAYPASNAKKRFLVERLQDRLVGHVRSRLWLLLGGVVVVLLIACANVATLLLIRAHGRVGEMAVRAALGATRGTLARQVLLETAVFAFVGGACGVLLGRAGIGIMRGSADLLVPTAARIDIGGPVLLAAVGLIVAVTLLAGAVPAVYLTRVSMAGGLGHAGRGSDPGKAGRRSRNLLIGLEVALSVVLLSGSGLLFRSVAALAAVPLGFDARDIVRFDLVRRGTLGEIRTFYRTLEDRLAALPGVTSVGSVYGAPLGSLHTTADVQVEGRPDPQPGTGTLAGMRAVSPHYLRTMRIPLRRGRTLEPSDDDGALPVAVVNERFVRENFAGEDPLGKRVRIRTDQGYGSPTWTIVGVVGDVRSASLATPPIAEIYVPHGQFGPNIVTICVRSARDPASLLTDIRADVRKMDALSPLLRVETMAEAVRRETRLVRFLMVAGLVFAAVSISLAAVGLYGALSFLVARRTHEIGIRMALGARRRAVARLIVVESASIVVVGTMAGLALSFWSGRFLQAFLFGVTPADPWTAALTLAILAAIVAVVTLLPARRAGRIDPITALRVE